MTKTIKTSPNYSEEEKAKYWKRRNNSEGKGANKIAKPLRGQGDKHKARGPLETTMYSNRKSYRSKSVDRRFTKKGFKGHERRVAQAKKDKAKEI